MEGASEYSMKSTSELPHPAGAWPYLSVVYVGWGLQCQSPGLLSIYQPNLLRIVSTSSDKYTSTNSSEIDRLLNRGSTHRPRERRRLRAEPLHQHICVGGPAGRTQYSSRNNYQTSDRKASSATACKTKATTTAVNNSSGSSKCHPDLGTDGRSRTR